jgi:Carboxypeptidase regulatory-like domain
MSASPSMCPPEIRPRPHAAAARLAVVLLGLVLAGGFPRRCEAQAESLAGRVVDKAGAGIAGARVWAIGGRWEEPQPAAQATTDAQGRFLMPRAWGQGGPASLHYLSMFARAGDGRIGWQTTLWRNGVDANDVRIELGPVGEARGRVVDQDGRPVAGAEVTPVLLIRSADPASNDYIRLSPDLATLYRTTTAADGSFRLEGTPQGGSIQATFAARGFGKPRISWDATRPATIAIDGRIGRIEGRLKPADARGLSGRFSVSLTRWASPDRPAPQSFQRLYFRTITADPDGTFRFEDLPPDRYTIAIEPGPGTPFAAQPVEDFAVGPNAVAKLEIPLERLVTITGRVVDAQTGKGIAGADLHGFRVDNPRSLQLAGQAETDADGRYTIATQPGMIQVQPSSVPTAYLGLYSDKCPSLKVAADRTWPDLKLARAMELDGIVVDPDGQPVVGAEVFVLKPNPARFSMPDAPIQTGPGGTFRLVQLDPDDTLPVWARSKSATTNGPVVIRPKEVKGKLTLTIDPKYAFRVRGMVTDRGGKRLEGARVTLSWIRQYVSERPEYRGTGMGSALGSYTIGEAGWFVFRDLWPGGSYQITVEARGHSKAEPPQVTGMAGETHDFGKLSLLNVSGHIAGRVVDSAGKPIANATVSNRGDGPKPVEARADAQGRFRLDGLFPGVKYAFIRQEGYRFTGVKCDFDADDLTITLLKTTEPPPAWKPGEAASYEDQRAFAKWVLTRLWEKYGKGANQNDAFVCMLDMARIDLELALQWSAEDGHRNDSRARQAAAEVLAETDGPGALKLLAQDRDQGSQLTMQQLAERFASTDPGKALLFAEESAAIALALHPSSRAAAGAVLARLGRVEAGRKLIDEAAETAARMGTDGEQAYHRGLVARALAPFDVKRALALIEPCKTPNDKERYTAMVAEAIAATDPARAVALADAMSGNGTYGEFIKTEVAYRIGADRPDEAVKILEGMKGHADVKMRAEAFGWLARAVAPRDRSRAFALIDRALASPIDNPTPFESWVYFGAATASAARIAATAKEIGYPDMDSIVMRAMATRPGGTRDDPAMQILSTTIAAVPLALVDPGSARVLLQQIEDRSGLDPVALSKVAGDRWLSAWALVDLKKAEALVEAELAALEKAKEPNLQSTGIFKMVEILATPPRRREAAAYGESSAAWHPGHQL